MSDYRHDDDAMQAPFDEDAYWGGEYEEDLEDYYYDEDDMDGDYDSAMESVRQLFTYPVWLGHR